MKRGPYRSTYCCLVDDRDYQKLSPDARLTLWTLKHSPANNIAGIFIAYSGPLEAQTGLSAHRVSKALGELELGRWILRDGDLTWVRNQLRFEPCYRLTHPDKRKGIENVLNSLPHSEIIDKFRAYYEIGDPPGRVSGGSRDYPPYQEQEQEQEQENPPTPLAGGQAPAEPGAVLVDLESWKGKPDPPKPKSKPALRVLWAKGFDPIYRNHPRKHSRAAAERAWAAMMPDAEADFRETFERINRLHRIRRKQWAERDPDKIPYFKTFLENESFDVKAIREARSEER